ncbi:ParA family protein [Eubacteriales bacterium OttesenSCG-928-A19]|nr:ParA family protein [Eubacteriales bacterium OttesenSCG-928-A19]
MARITTIINQKGGVGKTTTAHALVAGLALEGHRPLAIDTDPQGNLSYTMNAETGGPGLYGVLRGEVAARDAILRTDQGDILPSTLMLSAADLEFTQTGREFLLRDALDGMLDDYTHVIIDSPPMLGIMTINALTASTDIIIPMGADIYSLQGLSQLYSTIDRVKRFCNASLHVAGLLITRYNKRAILTRDLTDAIGETAKRLDTPLYETIIREGIAIKEAQTQRTSPFAAHKDANPMQDYLAFTREYLAQEGDGA